MIECIQGEGGVLALDKDFVKAVADICGKEDILLIVDEVQTGNGRTGKMYAYMNYGITPDIVSTAKGIGGGLPMGGVLFGEKTCDVLQPGNHGTTYGGNPVACAGAVEVLTRIDERFLEEVREKSSYLKGRLLEISGVSDVSGLGLMLGVTLDVKPAADFVKEALAMGLMTLTAKEKVRLLPPLTITYEEIDKGLEIFRKPPPVTKLEGFSESVGVSFGIPIALTIDVVWFETPTNQRRHGVTVGIAPGCEFDFHYNENKTTDIIGSTWNPVRSIKKWIYG